MKDAKDLNLIVRDLIEDEPVSKRKIQWKASQLREQGRAGLADHAKVGKLLEHSGGFTDCFEKAVGKRWTCVDAKSLPSPLDLATGWEGDKKFVR